MPAPRVSVCIPTYNYAHFLEQAVGSVLAQSFEDFELLVRDDASSDDTVAVMQQFLGDPRVKFTVNEVNAGLFANFNAVAREAQGEFVKYLCADDWIDPEFLARTVALLDAHPEAPLATTADWLVGMDGERFAAEVQPYGDGPTVAPSVVIDNATVGYNPIGMPSNTLVRREDLLAVGVFDAEYAPAADIELWFKLLARGELAWTPDRLTSIRIHNAHTHSYGGDPNDSWMRVWRDAPKTTGGLVTAEQSARGMRTEAARFAIFAAKHAAAGRLGRARELMRVESRYVPRTRAAARFLGDLPGLLRDRLTVRRAAREGRYVVYAPRPTIGEPKD